MRLIKHLIYTAWVSCLFFPVLFAQDVPKTIIQEKDKKHSDQSVSRTKRAAQTTIKLSEGDKYLPYGGVFTPKGDLHALIVFVGIKTSKEDENQGRIFNHQDYDNWNILKGEELPAYINPETGENPLFYVDKSDFRKYHNKAIGISEYYYQMSGGTFRFTGEVLKNPDTGRPVRIDVDASKARSIKDLTHEAMDEIYKKFPKFDWSRFDQRENFPNYKFDNSKTDPDGKPDCIVFVFRSHNGMKTKVFKKYKAGWGGGIATSYLGGYKSKWPGVTFDNAGYTSSNESAKSVEQLRSFFLHEVGHKLYASPHYNGANGEVGDYFFYPSNAYGMMNTSGILNAAANGWERWACGWIEIQDAHGKNAFLEEESMLKGQYEFYLDDFVETGNAVRVKIPYTENQFLWIENHLKQSIFDDNILKGEVLSRGGERVPPVDEGVYIYIERISEKRTYIPRYGKRSDSNGIKLLHANGNWDYSISKTGTRDWGDYYRNKIYVFEQQRENPISGISPFQRYVGDLPKKEDIAQSKDGKIKYTNSGHGGYIESVDILKEKVGNREAMLYGSFGGRNKEAYEIFKRRSAFFQAGDELSLSGITPVVNLRKYNDKTGVRDPFVPNGLQVRILEKNEDGRVKVSVNFGDFEIRKDTRWTGSISIEPNYIDTTEISMYLKPGVTLTLDKSATPDRHIPTESGDFVTATRMVLESGTIFRIGRKSELVLKDDSQLILKKGAKIILERGAEISKKDQAQIILEPGAEILKANRSGKYSRREDIERKWRRTN